MKIAHDSIVDRFWQDGEPRQPLASWYAQGRSDGLGDRLLMFDNTSASSLELLRFRPEFAAALGFESALRERVARLAQFRHPAFPKVRAVEYLEDGEGLALISTHTPGKRLSDIFQSQKQRAGLSPAFGIWLIRQLTPALAALQEHGEGISHGALAPDRIVLSPDGRWMILEHVLGSALERLQLPGSRLWTDLGVVMSGPEEETVPSLDVRSDVIQLALIALSVMLGRRVTPDDYPGKLEQLLDEFAANAGRRSPALVSPLRGWLERALQLHAHVFESAGDAEEGLAELPDERSPQSVDEYRGPVLRLPAQADGYGLATSDLDRTGSLFGLRPTLSAVPRPAAQIAAQFGASTTTREHVGVPVLTPTPNGEDASLSELLDARALDGSPSHALLGSPTSDGASERIVASSEQPENESRTDFTSAVDRSESDELARLLRTDARETREAPPSRVLSYQFSAASPVTPAPPTALDRRDLSRPVVEPDLSLGSIAAREIATLNAGANRKLMVGFVLVVLVAIAEAVVIGRLRTPSAVSVAPQSMQVPVIVESPDPGAAVIVDGRQVGVTPVQVKLGSETRSLRVMTRESLIQSMALLGNEGSEGNGGTAENAATRQSDVSPGRSKASGGPGDSGVPGGPGGNEARGRAETRSASTGPVPTVVPAKSGGLRLVSPIDVQIVDGDRVLGSSADGAILTTAGRHELELVNNTVGFRANRTVDLKAGQVLTLTLSPPDGRVSINAVPWAQVWIDGTSAGETPLANLSIPLGEHEFTFRHPQLGERHQTAIVRAGALTRVSVTFAK